MLYNPKADYPFWLRDNITQTKILKAGMASMDFICKLYIPTLNLAGELLKFLDSDQIELDQEIKWMILDTIHELHAEVAFYQNIIKESFLDDSNS